MKEKCKKCKKESETNWDINYLLFHGDLCYSCKTKQERNVLIIMGIVVIGIFLGLRILWANYVYNDIRCVIAECRIMK